jgi:hypothetical protein
MALYGDDLDVEALLEAPYKNNEGEESSKNGETEKKESSSKKK